MLRRNFLLTVAALATLPLAACNLPGGSVTLDQIVAQIKDKCQYATSWQAIAAVVSTVLSGFNQAAGAATAVAASVADEVITMICNAVNQKVSALSNKKAAQPHMDVVVNGVTVHGDYLGS